MRLARLCARILLPLVLAGCAAPAVPQAQQYSSIAGTVADATTNSPIPGATITVDVVNTATTGASGAFLVGNLPNGPVECSASAPNYVTRNNDWCSAPLPPGQTVNVGTIKLTHT
jgi:hypothetical protein